MSNAPDPNSPDVRPPFWKHRYAYAFYKVAVLAAAAYIALRLFKS